MHRYSLFAAVIAAAASATDLVAQDSAKVEIISVGSTNVQVTRQGRVLAETLPAKLTLASGVQNLRVGNMDYCIYLVPGATARLIVVPGSQPQLSGAQRCEDIWSEIIIDSVPTGVDIRPSRGEVSKRGSSVVIRIPLPDTVRVSVGGIAYASQTDVVRVAAMERQTYRLRLVPSAPTLLPDTTAEGVPAAPSAPANPTHVAPPRDPSSALADASAKLKLMRSREPAAGTSAVFRVPTILAAVTAAVIGVVWVADTSHPRRQLGKPFGISLGVTAVLEAVWWPTNRTATKRAAAAGCGSKRSAWKACEASEKADVDRLDAELRSLPARRVQWASDTLKQQQDFQRALAEYPARKAAWDNVARDIGARNQARLANRSENERRTRDWEAKVKESPLILVSRGKRS
jgi:hypothetical protein